MNKYFLIIGTTLLFICVALSGAWDIKDNNLVLNVEIFQSDTTYSYSHIFSDNDKTLELTDLDTDKITVCLKQ